MSRTPDQHDMTDEEIAAIAHEREERLAEETRPDGAEVNNTRRDFDATKGMFTDSPGYEEAPAPFPDPADEDPART